jgi:hypothetical protein
VNKSPAILRSFAKRVLHSGIGLRLRTGGREKNGRETEG